MSDQDALAELSAKWRGEAAWISLPPATPLPQPISGYGKLSTFYGVAARQVKQCADELDAIAPRIRAQAMLVEHDLCCCEQLEIEGAQFFCGEVIGDGPERAKCPRRIELEKLGGQAGERGGPNMGRGSGDRFIEEHANPERPPTDCNCEECIIVRHEANRFNLNDQGFWHAETKTKSGGLP